MTDDPIDISITLRGATAELTVAGACDMVAAERLTAAVAGLQEQGIRQLILDLRPMTFVDSSGLHALMALDAAARLNGHNLTVVRPPERVFRTFQLVGLAEHFVYVDDPDELTPPAA